MSKYKATAYIRLSYTDDRSSESDSVSNQRKLIENFVEHNPDIEIVSEKIDDGYSGIIFDRPAFKEMMQDVSDGNINCVIVKDLSRLGREYIETGRYLRRVFPAYGVRFIAITDNIDTAHENSSDDLAVSVKNIMNEAYCRDISIKTRTSLDVKRRNGDFVGAFTVYGYIKSEENKNQLVPDPYASRVVKDIFRMRLEGASALRIANELNRLGILSPLAYKRNNGLPYAKKGYTDKADCKWSATTIIRILQDETYVGTLVQGKQGTPHYKIKQTEQRPTSEWVRVQDAHEPLIDRQDFELVQRIKSLDTRTAPKENTVHLFSGILVCGCCSSRMTRKTNHAGGKEYHYYYCPTGKKKGCTHPVMLKESSLIACVQDSLKAYIDNVASLETLLAGIDQASINKALAKEYSDHIADNERRLEKVLEYKAGLYETLIGGMLTKEEYTAYKAMYTKQAEEIRESIRLLEEKLTAVLENRSERNRWISQFTQFSTMETLDRKALIHMVQSIRVLDKNELAITFTYEDEYKKALQLIALAEQERQIIELKQRKAG
ncbi:MAG: recombinase family protein [Eubacteriales bacterium]